MRLRVKNGTSWSGKCHIISRHSTSDRLCEDEIFSIWYGLGGDWINLGLPNYVNMDRNTDDG